MAARQLSAQFAMAIKAGIGTTGEMAPNGQ
jgi:hypothetical protein